VLGGVLDPRSESALLLLLARAAADIRPSDWTQSQALGVTDVDQAIFDRINERYGLNVEMRMKKFFEAQKKP
jgi:hypothetical protein